MFYFINSFFLLTNLLFLYQTNLNKYRFDSYYTRFISNYVAYSCSLKQCSATHIISSIITVNIVLFFKSPINIIHTKNIKNNKYLYTT